MYVGPIFRSGLMEEALMTRKSFRWLALGAGAAAGAYAAYAGTTWLRYGRTKPARAESQDPSLDVFMPDFEVAERHEIEVAAGLLEAMKSIGWSVLATIPDREVVVGAVTKPWEANVVFRSVPADEFAAFNEPDYVKIAWTLRADPVGPGHSIARTETRVMTTDAASRRKFRRYWSLVSPGILLIRRFMLKRVKALAEARCRPGLQTRQAI